MPADPVPVERSRPVALPVPADPAEPVDRSEPVDRFAEAVRARRAELRQARQQLAGAHRAELRSALALARVAESDALGAALGRLTAQAQAHVDADRARRTALPALLGPALDGLAAAVHAERAAHLRATLRVITGSRGLETDPHWPLLPGPRLPVTVVVPPPPRSRSGGSPPAPTRPGPARPGLVRAGAALHCVAVWRAAVLPLVLLPLLGLPAPAGPAVIPFAAAAGAVGVAVAVRAQRIGRERTALRACVHSTLAAARVALDADLVRRFLELERLLGADLDRAADARRTRLDAELTALAPRPRPEVPGA